MKLIDHIYESKAMAKKICLIEFCGVKGRPRAACINQHRIHIKCLRQWKRVCQRQNVITTCPICRVDSFMVNKKKTKINDYPINVFETSAYRYQQSLFYEKVANVIYAIALITIIILLVLIFIDLVLIETDPTWNAPMSTN